MSIDKQNNNEREELLKSQKKYNSYGKWYLISLIPTSLMTIGILWLAFLIYQDTQQLRAKIVQEQASRQQLVAERFNETMTVLRLLRAKARISCEGKNDKGDIKLFQKKQGILIYDLITALASVRVSFTELSQESMQLGTFVEDLKDKPICNDNSLGDETLKMLSKNLTQKMGNIIK